MSAHATDNDFGADNVASKPATAFTTLPFVKKRSVRARPSDAPVVGSQPDSNDSSASVDT